MICRKKALLNQLESDWDKLNLAAKSLVIMGGLLFVIEIYFTLIGGGNLAISNKIEVIFRSSLASVFGFILSSNTKNTDKIKPKDGGLVRGEVIDKEKKACKSNEYYNYGDGNSVQIFIALITCLASAIVILIIYTRKEEINISILSQLRDLMCTSIGFLLGESKIKSN